VILYDKRGTGLSDPVDAVPTLESRADDLRSVLEAAGSERVALSINIRCGLHTGECEIRGDDIGGIAVHIGARIGALAPAAGGVGFQHRLRIW
jgi:class 3 adenylate cyclase